MGFRDNNNNPDGYDVDFCRDLANVLGVELEVVETDPGVKGDTANGGSKPATLSTSGSSSANSVP